MTLATHFTNHIGQTIEPGDKVITVSMGRSSRVRIRVGIFKGLSASGSPQVTWDRTATRWIHADGTVSRHWAARCRAEKFTEATTSTLPAGRIYRLG